MKIINKSKIDFSEIIQYFLKHLPYINFTRIVNEFLGKSWRKFEKIFSKL